MVIDIYIYCICALQKPTIAPKPQVPPPPPPKPATTLSESLQPKNIQTLNDTSIQDDDLVADNINTNSTEATTHDESPEKLSLKARLKLFEKEIEQQGSTAPLPRTG